jgi:hypothetical protein
MPLKVVWSFVTVVCGALSVAICGGHQMLELPVVNWDSLLKVLTSLQWMQHNAIYKYILSFQELLLF